MLFIIVAACLAVVSINLIMLGVFLVAMEEIWSIINRYLAFSSTLLDSGLANSYQLVAARRHTSYPLSWRRLSSYLLLPKESQYSLVARRIIWDIRYQSLVSFLELSSIWSDIHIGTWSLCRRWEIFFPREYQRRYDSWWTLLWPQHQILEIKRKVLRSIRFWSLDDI